MTFVVLHSENELASAEERARSLGLCPLPDPRKYWDNMLALETLEQRGLERSAPIVDLGCRSGILVTWLDQVGYRQLHGCDLRYPLPPLKAALRRRQIATVFAGLRAAIRHRTRMRQARVERTGFPSRFFAAATCMSVIEHGVDLERFCAECARLLRPGGVLVVSTDYWPERIDTRGLKRFSATERPDLIVDRAGALEFCAIAERHQLHVVGDLELDADDPIIVSDGFRFTFLFMVFERA